MPDHATAPATDRANAPRHIVLLSDGTGNSRGKANQTNVWRVYEALDLRDPVDLKTPRQFAFYDDGVGSSSFLPLAVLGGVFGWGLARNVQDLYAFLCRMYRPGDRIYAFGFSRGAFTVRVLVGLISSQGIVRYEGNEAELRRRVAAAYRAYRRRYRIKYVNYIGVPRWARDRALDALAILRRTPTYDQIQKSPDTRNHGLQPDSSTPSEVVRRTLKRAWDHLLGRKLADLPCTKFAEPPVTFVGLWDTVDAYGVPVDELGAFINAVVWPFRMPDARLSPVVAHAAHALALDDERNTFHPRLWDEDERITQVWFAGMHSDVGGGYPDKGLSHVSLSWMTDAASALTPPLRFVPETLQAQRALSDENGPMNDSRRGLAGYYRYNPRRLDQLTKPHGIERPLVHESVMRRIRAGQDAYAPIVLPKSLDVLSTDGRQRISGSKYLGECGPLYSGTVSRVFNHVWLRRILYFATLGVTLALLAVPLVSEDLAGCASSWCGASAAIRAVGLVLPSFATAWTTWYVNRPELFFGLGAVVLAGLLLGGSVQRTIFDTMRGIWYAMPATTPDSMRTFTRVKPLSGLGRMIEQARESMPYQAVLKLFRHLLLPVGFGLSLLILVAIMVNNGYYAGRVAGGKICRAPGTPSLTLAGDAASRVRLTTWEACAAVGVRVERGGTYQLDLTIDQPWIDGGYPPDPAGPKKGVTADLRGVQRPTWMMRLATLLKREGGQRYLQPMARIGDKGSNVIVLQSEPSWPAGRELTTLRARFVAPGDGELYLYVNDAVGWPGNEDFFLRNNCGTASGTVRLVMAVGANAVAGGGSVNSLDAAPVATPPVVGSPAPCR